MLQHQFHFAGFSWPRYVAVLPRGPLRARAAERKTRCTGDYYHAPKPNDNSGRGFYLDGDGMPGLRWEYSSDTEYYADEYGHQTIRGLIMRLPHNRGFLAGHTMGERMSSGVGPDIYAEESDARRAAECEAERIAESEREYSERWSAATELTDDVEQLLADIDDARAEHSAAIYARQRADDGAHFLRFGNAARDLRESVAEMCEQVREKRDTLATEYKGVL